jgi:hypothetical protein
MADVKTQNYLLGLCGTGNMAIGLALCWFSKPPEYGGPHFEAIAGMLFILAGLIQKAVAMGGLLDGNKPKPASETPRQESETLEQIAADLAWFKEIKSKEIVRARAAEQARKSQG